MEFRYKTVILGLDTLLVTKMLHMLHVFEDHDDLCDIMQT